MNSEIKEINCSTESILTMEINPNDVDFNSDIVRQIADNLRESTKKTVVITFPYTIIDTVGTEELELYINNLKEYLEERKANAER